MVDFFEHCQLSNDVEFGGNDVLQVYNTAQVKHRLNTTGMYIASTKVLTCSLYTGTTNVTCSRFISSYVFHFFHYKVAVDHLSYTKEVL